MCPRNLYEIWLLFLRLPEVSMKTAPTPRGRKKHRDVNDTGELDSAWFFSKYTNRQDISSKPLSIYKKLVRQWIKDPNEF